MGDEQNTGQGQTPAANTEQTSSRAIIALVLGIVGFFFCQPLGIAAWIMGGRERKAIAAGQAPQSGMGLATAAWIIGIIDTILLIVGIVVAVVVIILSIVAAGTATAPRF